MQAAVTRELITRLISEAQRAWPEECCGLLTGATLEQAKPVVTRNVHPDPNRNFEIDPALLIRALKAERAGGHPVLGYYHSHPAGPAEPSLRDSENASGDGKIWAIIAVDGTGPAGEVRFWQDMKDGFVPLATRIIGT
ncbi:MAG: M67 family metallopeptidase [Sphingomonadaceae bacterium]